MHWKSFHNLSKPILSFTKQIWLQMNTVHNVAATGFNQGNHYDSNRPSYTDEAIRYIVDVLSELSPLNRKDLKYDVLELGAGTGKFTEKITSCISQVYIDDVLSLNNSKFGDYVKGIYPIELEIKDITDTVEAASYLDLHLEIDNEDCLKPKLYDKRDVLSFPIVNFPFLCSNIPAAPAYRDVKYLASEPSESFLGVLRNKVPSFVDCASCTADALPLPNNSVKLIIAAQCFHWFANHENLQELYRVLVPGGRFVMLWNNKDRSIPWVKPMEDILTQYYDEDTPRAVTYKWKQVIESFSGFTLKNHQLLPGIQMKGDRDFVVGHFSSISVISRLSLEEKQEALAKFYNVLGSSEMTKDMSEIQIPFHTEIYDVEKMVL